MRILVLWEIWENNNDNERRTAQPISSHFRFHQCALCSVYSDWNAFKVELLFRILEEMVQSPLTMARSTLKFESLLFAARAERETSRKIKRNA